MLAYLAMLLIAFDVCAVPAGETTSGTPGGQAQAVSGNAPRAESEAVPVRTPSPKPLTNPVPSRQSAVGAPSKAPTLIYAFELTPRYFVGVNDINHSLTDPETGTRSFTNYLAPITDSAYGSLYLSADLKTPYRFEPKQGRYTS